MNDAAEWFFQQPQLSREAAVPPVFRLTAPGSGPPGEQGPQGDAGAQGAQGYQGIRGEGGSVGPGGPQGVQGDAGDQGAQGAPGAQGPTGAQGAQGDTGPQGFPSMVQGPQGAAGPQGPAGADAEKGAMVRVSGGPPGRPYARLFCAEAPEVWFFDFVRIPAGEQRTARVDPLFIEACEPGSLFVAAVDKPFKAFLSKDQREVYATDTLKPLVVTLYGVRKGCGPERRFAPHTAEQAAENNRFWKQQFSGEDHE